MKPKNRLEYILFLSFCFGSTALAAENRFFIPKQQQANTNRDQLRKKLLELRNILNQQLHNIEDPAVLSNIINLMKIAVPLAIFALVGYKAYQQTFGDQAAEQIVVTAPMKMPARVPHEMPHVPHIELPSYAVSQFFNSIENIKPQQITYLDILIPQLEQKYSLAAKDVKMGNASLITAVIDAKYLDDFNKAELIRWLREYGVQFTEQDKQKARLHGGKIIINAVTN
jgi:hypothetical protein